MSTIRFAMEPDSQHDTFLLGRIAAGDGEAFAELFARHAAVVLGLLSRLLASRAVAEEVLQETFLQAWREAQRYRPGAASPRGWLIMLARSRALDRLRSRGAEQRREEAFQPVGAAAVVAPVGTERLEREEDQQRLHSALSTLPEEQRAAIELAFFGGLTQSQIAARLGAPLGTIKSRMLLGMRKLRESFEAGGAPC